MEMGTISSSETMAKDWKSKTTFFESPFENTTLRASVFGMRTITLKQNLEAVPFRASTLKSMLSKHPLGSTDFEMPARLSVDLGRWDWKHWCSASFHNRYFWSKSSERRTQVPFQVNYFIIVFDVTVFTHLKYALNTHHVMVNKL